MQHTDLCDCFYELNIAVVKPGHTTYLGLEFRSVLCSKGCVARSFSFCLVVSGG